MAGRDAEQLVRRRRAVSRNAEQLQHSRAATQSRASERAGRFASDGGAQAATTTTLTAAEEVHLSRQLRMGRAAETVRRELGDAASDAEWAFHCGLSSVAALRLVLSQAQTARSLLLARNMGLVRTVARRLANSLGNVRVDDLMADGLMGLCSAIELFDPERGYRFSTFAYARVEAAQRRAIQNGRSSIRVPVWVRFPKWISQLCRALRVLTRYPIRLSQVQEVQSKLLKARAAFAADGMMQPSDEALAAAANAPLAHVVAASGALSQREVSFDAVLDEPESTSMLYREEDSQLWPQQSAEAEAELPADVDPWARSVLQRFEQQLDTDVQRAAMRALYGLDGGTPQTPAALAKKLGLTRHSLNRLLLNGLTRMSAAA